MTPRTTADSRTWGPAAGKKRQPESVSPVINQRKGQGEKSYFLAVGKGVDGHASPRQQFSWPQAVARSSDTEQGGILEKYGYLMDPTAWSSIQQPASLYNNTVISLETGSWSGDPYHSGDGARGRSGARRKNSPSHASSSRLGSSKSGLHVKRAPHRPELLEKYEEKGKGDGEGDAAR